MTPRDLLRSESAKWLGQADKDRIAAEALLLVEPSRSAFHSQQVAGKGLKAFLTARQISFHRTHDLADLGAQCAALDPSLDATVREAAELTDYASAFRYPDAPWEPDSTEATAALATATRLLAEIRRRLA